MPRLAFVTGCLLLTLPGPRLAQAQSPTSDQSLTAATRTVVEAIASAAAENRHRPQHWEGDQLTAHFVRRAALAAAKLPKDVSVKAYLLGLGIGLDHSGVLQKAPLVSQLMPAVESPGQRQRRLIALGCPTMRGRRDLTQHFVVSAALTGLLGAEAAEKAGVLKEIYDAQGGTGFSFADLAANLAGVTFAQRLGQGSVSLAEVAETFRVEDFVLDPKEFPEGLQWKNFADRYGSTEDQRFLTYLETIRRNVLALPGYHGGCWPENH